jgi:hypothetical protein
LRVVICCVCDASSAAHTFISWFGLVCKGWTVLDRSGRKTAEDPKAGQVRRSDPTGLPRKGLPVARAGT